MIDRDPDKITPIKMPIPGPGMPRERDSRLDRACFAMVFWCVPLLAVLVAAVLAVAAIRQQPCP